MKRVAIAAALLLAAGLVLPAVAQPYPNRAVTIIVPYAAGGPVDELARLIANALSAKMKQTFIVENVTGASTITGTSRVAHAPADGYTLLVHNLQIAANATR